VFHNFVFTRATEERVFTEIRVERIARARGNATRLLWMENSRESWSIVFLIRFWTSRRRSSSSSMGRNYRASFSFSKDARRRSQSRQSRLQQCILCSFLPRSPALDTRLSIADRAATTMAPRNRAARSMMHYFIGRLIARALCSSK